MPTVYNNILSKKNKCLIESSQTEPMTTETRILNDHNKAEYPPMHTVEHILNQTMVRMFGCERSRNAHIERKKSKCDYNLPCAPTEEQIAEIESRVNEVIAHHLPVTTEFVTRDNVPEGVDLGKLPADASETLRIVRIGNYDTCACIGTHVENTAEIGTFKIISHTFENGTLRLRFKLVKSLHCRLQLLKLFCIFARIMKMFKFVSRFWGFKRFLIVG